jgi:tRNA (adenine58-N1)-methyltransferase non-catalytic subunit
MLSQEETEATNELISASGAQSLTMEDIEALKAEGLSGRDIIEAQVTGHASFELKNEYSKIKYRQRKESKCVEWSSGEGDAWTTEARVGETDT